MSKIAESRKKIIRKYVDVSASTILEIGALDAPTFERSNYDVKYLDHASKDELNRLSGSNPRYSLETLVDVDYVCPTPEYSSLVLEKFDLVVANHVIEHVPDTIRWLQEIHHILGEEGMLFLSIPDKRYTFDIARNNTNFIDLLKIYDTESKKPDFYQILEHFYYHKTISTKDAWSGNVDEQIKQKRFDINTALKVAKKHAEATYADVHCHVFTADSFRELMADLTELKLLPFEKVSITPVKRGANEFHVILHKTLADLTPTKLQCFSSLLAKF